MLIVMKPEATDAEIENVLKIIRELGYKPHPMPGATTATAKPAKAVKKAKKASKKKAKKS